MKKLHFSYKLDPCGVICSVNEEDFQIYFPEEVWHSFPWKDQLAIELLYLQTMSLPLMAHVKNVHYSTPAPLFLGLYQEWLLRDLPSLMDMAPLDSSWVAARRFKSLKYSFLDSENSTMPVRSNDDSKATIALSLGSDSLTSLAVAWEMGLELSGVYIADPLEQHKIDLKTEKFKNLEKLTDMKTYQVLNEAELIRENELWNPWRSRINNMLLLVQYMLMLIPFAYHTNSRYLIVGNELDISYDIILKKSGKIWKEDWLQTSQGTSELDKWISELTEGGLRVLSPIGSLHDFSKYWIMHKTLPLLGENLASCLWPNTSDSGRWCSDCEKCVKTYLYLSACGNNPKEYDFDISMFDKSKKHFFQLFSRKKKISEREFHMKQQELLAFLLAGKNGSRGWAIDKFNISFKKESEKKEIELSDKYLNVSNIKADYPLVKESEFAAQRLLDGTFQSDLLKRFI